MALGYFAREYIRTCRECGYSWRVPRAIAHQAGRGMSAITLRGSIGSAQQPGRIDGIAAAVGARADQIEAFRICARCGVDNFAQRPARRADNNIVPGTGGFSLPR
jgi:hypothetical protein